MACVRSYPALPFIAEKGFLSQGMEKKAKEGDEALFEEDGWEEHGCSICLEIFDETNPYAPTRCGHEFHLQCIMEWLQRSCECPLCITVMEFLAVKTLPEEATSVAAEFVETLPEEEEAEVATLVTAAAVVEILPVEQAEVALATPTLVTAGALPSDTEAAILVRPSAANAGVKEPLLAVDAKSLCETSLPRLPCCPSVTFKDLWNHLIPKLPSVNFKDLWKRLLSKLGLALPNFVS